MNSCLTPICLQHFSVCVHTFTCRIFDPYDVSHFDLRKLFVKLQLLATSIQTYNSMHDSVAKHLGNTGCLCGAECGVAHCWLADIETESAIVHSKAKLIYVCLK